MSTPGNIKMWGISKGWGIFGSNFCVSEKRDRKWIEGFEIEFLRFC